MPRTVLEPRFQVEYLSILDSEGHLDTALEPKLSPGELRSSTASWSSVAASTSAWCACSARAASAPRADQGSRGVQLRQRLHAPATDWMYRPFARPPR